LLEHPARPAATVTAAAMPTNISCFATGLLCLSLSILEASPVRSQ
jgi:hypothetical protein